LENRTVRSLTPTTRELTAKGRVSNRAKHLILSLILFVCSTFSQSIYLPSSHEVYQFLRRMESRGLLQQYRDAARPLSRRDLARHLKDLAEKAKQMTSVERDIYEFLKGEFQYELSSLDGDSEPSEIRWHLLSTDLPKGIVHLDLIGQYFYRSVDKESVRLRSQGAKITGYVYDDFGFYFNFIDNREVGKAINRPKLNIPDPGIIQTGGSGDVLEYDMTEAQLTWQAGEFQFSLEKMQNVWGLGRRGTLAFSEKAPSYPQIKLRVPLASWIDFVYFHAELNSQIIDSVRSYHAGSSPTRDFFRSVNRLKYLAAHQLEITPLNGLDIALGESIVYGDRGVDFIYLIPIMYFKGAEHYNRDTDNTQWFFSFDINAFRNVNVYSSIFIDELNSDEILNPTRERNQVGYTIGLQTYDLMLENLEFLVEYTRLNPWVYSHKYPSTNFTNNGYDLGHWIGQNADNLFLGLTYRPMRALVLGGSYEIYRKGGLKDIAYQYALPSQPFLYGPLREERTLGIEARYQFVRDGFLDVHFRSRTLSDESARIDKKATAEFSIGVRYGVW